MNKTAIILGTSNYSGNTRKLVELCAEPLGADVFMLKDHQISVFDYQHQNLDDDFIPLVEQLLQYQHLIFATPVYWYSMSAQMKVFFDRITDLLTVRKELGRQLRGKSASVIATSGSEQAPECFIQVFSQSFAYLGMDYRGLVHCDMQQDIQEDVLQQQVDDFVALVGD